MRYSVLCIALLALGGPVSAQDEYPLPPPPSVAPPSPFKVLEAKDAAGLLLLQTRYTTGSRHGTAVIVDVGRRLALTAWHGVANSAGLSAYAPGADVDSNVLSAQTVFNAKKGIPLEVVHREPQHDLALIRLAELPKGCAAIPVAKSGPAAESALYLDGNPYEKNMLWQRVEGSAGAVRASSWRWPDGQQIDTRILPVPAATSLGAGYSGGAVRNGSGELVGLIIAGSGLETLSIDGVIIREFLGRAEAVRAPLTTPAPRVDPAAGPKALPR